MWVSFRKVTRRPTNPLTKARNFLRTGRHLPEFLLESPEAEREGLVQGNEREEKRRPKRTSTSAVKRRRERKTDED